MTDAASLNADELNADASAGRIDRVALDAAIAALGIPFQDAITTGHDFLYADAALFVASAQMMQMRDVVAAVERVVKLPGWMDSTSPPPPPRLGPSLRSPLPQAGEEVNVKSHLQPLGVFYGYDFHLNDSGVHLIEINTNAGGALLNALLIASQNDVALPGSNPVHAEVSKHESSSFDTSGRTEKASERADLSLEQIFLDMFRNEWELVRGDAPLNAIAIVDEQPGSQYLYPEFLLAQRMFEYAGIEAYIIDPSALQYRNDGLYLGEKKIDLVYNRLTDFSLQQHPALQQAYANGGAVVTPSPAHYARYADKRNLARLGDAHALRALGASADDIAVLQAGVPHTFPVHNGSPDTLWQQRKELFFKPVSGYGSKGAYRGDKLTKRVFEEIMQGGYVAQRLAPPGERMLYVDDSAAQPLRYDVRCYVYDGKIQLVAARLYQGQTTNFRTPGGGFALVRVVE